MAAWFSLRPGGCGGGGGRPAGEPDGEDVKQVPPAALFCRRYKELAATWRFDYTLHGVL